MSAHERLQGDREAACGLPVSAMCNRVTMNMPRAQLGFINIFLKVSDQRHVGGLRSFSLCIAAFSVPLLEASHWTCNRGLATVLRGLVAASGMQLHAAHMLFALAVVALRKLHPVIHNFV
mgnify:CR=1 FL=1